MKNKIKTKESAEEQGLKFALLAIAIFIVLAIVVALLS